MRSADPSQMAIKASIPSDGSCTHSQPHDCHTPPAASTAISEFLARSPADDAPPDAPTSLSENFRHGGWMPFRRRVEQALLTTEGITPRRIAAFRLCGCDAFVEARSRNPGLPSIKEYRIRQTKCHDRFCVPCSQERSNRIRMSLLKHMHPLENLKLITLTLAASDDTLSQILDRITRCFRLLRNKPLWNKNVQGGCAIIETKLGAGSKKWHVHFHVVAQSRYIPQDKLAELWQQITGDSRIVDIRPVGAKTGAVQYITKYITKAADHSIVMSPRHLSEALTAFHGRRLVTTFGTWRGLELMEKPANDNDYYYDENLGSRQPKPAWRPIGSLDAVLSDAAAGSPYALDVVRKLRRGPRPPPPDGL